MVAPRDLIPVGVKRIYLGMNGGSLIKHKWVKSVMANNIKIVRV
jgi:hypothetical protein